MRRRLVGALLLVHCCSGDDATAGVAVTAITGDGPQQFLIRTKVPLEADHLAPASFLD